ncbi:BnaA08g07340D [Brassica napus]|uniref:BnaA08g07340D protein n=1 Tax=Brassica napus TaxID=3708 RepID=A0A078IEJ7_BRANA|nr:BnaA08g07340D [Brassica napus]
MASILFSVLLALSKPLLSV